MSQDPTNHPFVPISWQRYAAYGTLALSFGLLLGWILLRGIPSLVGSAPAEYSGFMLEGPDLIGEFELTDHFGNPMNLSDYRGKVTLVYYGYTYCPDVCPTTLVELGTAIDELGNRSDEVQVLMVSVDPERDHLERLQQYVTYFHPQIMGATGTDDQLAAATVPYGIFHEKHQRSTGADYLINHSAGVLLFDKTGRLRLMFPYGLSGEAMAEDIKQFTRPRPRFLLTDI